MSPERPGVNDLTAPLQGETSIQKKRKGVHSLAQPAAKVVKKTSKRSKAAANANSPYQDVKLAYELAREVDGLVREAFDEKWAQLREMSGSDDLLTDSDQDSDSENAEMEEDEDEISDVHETYDSIGELVGTEGEEVDEEEVLQEVRPLSTTGRQEALCGLEYSIARMYKDHKHEEECISTQGTSIGGSGI